MDSGLLPLATISRNLRVEVEEAKVELGSTRRLSASRKRKLSVQDIVFNSIAQNTKLDMLSLIAKREPNGRKGLI